jgi:hypothetical protein
MIRSAYRGVLFLHPAPFRDRYGEEFLWIFDLRKSEETGIALLFDCLGSLARQWLFRSGLWKYAVSFVLNCVIFHKMIWYFLGIERLVRMLQ